VPTLARHTGDGFLMKESVISWADCLAQTPELFQPLQWQIDRHHTTDWGQKRSYLYVDVSGMVEPTEMTLTLTLEDGLAGGSFTVYYYDWGTLTTADWVAEAGLTAASALVELDGSETSVDIPLISDSGFLGSNGKFVLIAEDEEVEPDGDVCNIVIESYHATVPATATGSLSLPTFQISGQGRAYQRVYGTGVITLPTFGVASSGHSFANIPQNLSRVKGGTASIQAVTSGRVNIHVARN
jgi:hypothetical protein